jgi:DNA-binding transcriptional LysR family regulator
MPGDDLNVLSALLAVAEARSFTKAARRLGVSPSAVSHAIRGLEERTGVRLLSRTTRSVAPTEAGERLIARLQPALGDVREALDELVRLRDRPAGRIRLAVSPMGAALVLAPKLAAFAAAYPDVSLEVTTTAGQIDIVSAGFDAGIQLGEYVERDMIAVRVSPDQRAAIVGSPAYFARHPAPRTPRELTKHQCVNFRRGTLGLYRWEFEKDGRALSVAVRGALTVDSADLLVRAAIDGAGLIFGFEAHVQPHLASGALVRVLEDWCPPFAGYFLYYPSRRHQPPALAALANLLRVSSSGAASRARVRSAGSTQS